MQSGTWLPAHLASLLAADALQAMDMHLSQPHRLWCSPEGAISPLHFDTSTSFLVQVTGAKRMLFYPPEQAQLLYLFPDTHMLRRRARVDPSEPDLHSFPLVQQAAALEAVLQPGDAILFPARWSHYTESIRTVNMSVTVRFSAPGG